MGPIRTLLDPFILMLLGVNLIPLYGVLEWGWGVFELIFIFWFENVIIGLMTAFKIVMNRPAEGLFWAGKLFMVPFFLFHYGMFTFVHGIFVISLFGGAHFSEVSPSNLQNAVAMMIEGSEGMALMASMLFLSNLVLTYREYFHNGRYREATLNAVMMEPYQRVAVLHLTIIFGGFLVMALHEPLLGLVMLVALKILFDIFRRRRERTKELAAASGVEA